MDKEKYRKNWCFPIFYFLYNYVECLNVETKINNVKEK